MPGSCNYYELDFHVLDVKAKTVSEGYNPLHLAACYLRHAYKPSKSAKPPETTDQPDTAEQDEIQRMQSDTLELPWSKKRRHSSNPPIPFERQTSCKEIFQFLVEDCEEIDVCVDTWVNVYEYYREIDLY